MKIITLLFFLTSLPVSAQYYRQYEYDRKNDPQLKEPPKPAEVNRTTPETTIMYLKSGFSVGSSGGENSDFNFGALGNRQYADEFYYGGEVSTHYGNKKLRTMIFDVTFGYHFLTWKHRIKPYIGGSFGYAKQKDSGNLNRPSANGVSLGLDLGFTIYRAGPFMVNTGINIHNTMFNNPLVKNSHFQDIYCMFAVAF